MKQWQKIKETKRKMEALRQQWSNTSQLIDRLIFDGSSWTSEEVQVLEDNLTSIIHEYVDLDRNALRLGIREPCVDGSVKKMTESERVDESPAKKVKRQKAEEKLLKEFLDQRRYVSGEEWICLHKKWIEGKENIVV